MMRVRLSRGSSYKLPITQRSVANGETIDITDVEWEAIKKTGRFILLEKLDLKDSIKPLEEVGVTPGIGLAKVTKSREIAKHLPENWTGKKILVRVVGGLGDAIVCTGIARTLKKVPCQVIFAVQKDQVKLIQQFEGVDKTIDAQTLNSVTLVLS